MSADNKEKFNQHKYAVVDAKIPDDKITKNSAEASENAAERKKLKAKRRTSDKTSIDYGSENSSDGNSVTSNSCYVTSWNLPFDIAEIEENNKISPACKKIFLDLVSNHDTMAERLQIQQKANEEKTNLITELQTQVKYLLENLEVSKQWQNTVYLQIQKITEYNTELSKRFSEVCAQLQSVKESSKTSKIKTKKVIKAAEAVIYGDSISAKKISERKKLTSLLGSQNKVVNDENLKNCISKTTTHTKDRKLVNTFETFKGEATNTLNATKEVKLQETLREQKSASTECKHQSNNGTEPKNISKDSSGELSIEESIRQAAQSAISNSGFSYDEGSGMYYDWNTKMYYDTSTQLYYDHENGIYYYYDAERESYIFHSQIKVETKNEKETGNKNNVVGEELSEGEIRSDDDEENASSEEVEGSENSVVDPCIRVIIAKSNSMAIGSLFIITCQGGTIGRETTNHISISDVMISRIHARIIYDKNERTFFIQDVKTQHGTFLNNERIAEPRSNSDPIELTHRDYVTIGDTTMSFHVHSGNETCFDCEPGNIQTIIATKNNETEQSLEFTDLKKQRKKEKKSMMKKYGLSPGYIPQKIINSIPDRAEERRKKVGSQPYKNELRPVEKASVYKEISENNVGHKMLAKMGWKSGEGLGKSSQGISQPVTIEVRGKSKGLGFGANGGKQSLDLDEKSSRRKEILNKTRERFNKLES